MGYHLRWLTASSILACVFLVGCVTLGILTIVRAEWIRYTVRLNNPSPLVKYTISAQNRTRGPLFLCVDQVQDANNSIPQDLILYGRCRQVLVYHNPNSLSTSDDVRVINLRRSHIALHITAIFIAFVVIIYFVIAVIISWFCNDHPHPRIVRKHMGIAGIFCAIGVLSYLAAFIVFHIMLNYENEDKNSYYDYLYQNWPDAVKAVTEISWIEMYALAWGSLGCELFAAILFLFAARFCYFTGGRNDLIKHSKYENPLNEPNGLMVPKPLNKSTNDSSSPPNGKMSGLNGGFYNSGATFDTLGSHHKANPVQMQNPSMATQPTLPRSMITPIPQDTPLIPIYYQNDQNGGVHLGRGATPDAFIAVRK